MRNILSVLILTVCSLALPKCSFANTDLSADQWVQSYEGTTKALDISNLEGTWTSNFEIQNDDGRNYHKIPVSHEEHSNVPESNLSIAMHSEPKTSSSESVNEIKTHFVQKQWIYLNANRNVRLRYLPKNLEKVFSSSKEALDGNRLKVKIKANNLDELTDVYRNDPSMYCKYVTVENYSGPICKYHYWGHRNSPYVTVYKVYEQAK